MSPTSTNLPLAEESDEHFVHVISSILSPVECTNIIHEHVTSLSSNATTHTNRLRRIFDDDELAGTLWDRLEPFYRGWKVVDEDRCSWTASGLNSRFRFCRYEAGGVFEPHIDGRYLASIDSQSFMTVNVYLNTVPPEHGGATRVLSRTVAGDDSRKHNILGKVQPAQGSASVFRDSLFHDGEELLAGEKYLLRTDIMFTRDEPFDINVVFGRLSDEEKGTKALKLAERLEDGGSHEEAIIWYKKAFRFCAALEQSR